MNDVSLNLVVIRSPDIERACRFYSALGLAFTKHAHGTGPEHYACEIGGIVFEIYPRKSEDDSRAPRDSDFASYRSMTQPRPSSSSAGRSFRRPRNRRGGGGL